MSKIIISDSGLPGNDDAGLGAFQSGTISQTLKMVSKAVADPGG